VRNKFIPDFTWNSVVEPPTLGGLLTVIAEAEMVTSMIKAPMYRLQVISEKFPSPIIEKFTNEVISRIRGCQMAEARDKPVLTWFDTHLPELTKSSHYDYAVLHKLIESGGKAPRLTWSSQTFDRVVELRSCLPAKTIAFHLKRVAPFDPEDSNAEMAVWSEAIERISRDDGIAILLVGDDQVTQKITPIHRVFPVKEFNLDLGEQLALIGLCTGYLGMASGLASAAIFSDLPYTIYKHPKHHSTQMDHDLGEGEHLLFAHEEQRIVRRLPSVDELVESAYQIVSI
jgi:hypothetical protein